MADERATAEGDLGRTPFAHLLVYALDRRLTGVLYLDEPGEGTHAVRFDQGAVVRVRSADVYARLGEELVRAGAVTDDDVEQALAKGGLLGRALVAAERIDEDALANALGAQLRSRVVRLFALPPETPYRYFDAHPDLEDAPGYDGRLEPLALLWAGISTHGPSPALLDATLARLPEGPLELHPDAPIARLGLDGDARCVVECLADLPTHAEALLEAEVIDEASLRRLLYLLTITRMLDFGGGAPAGTGERIPPPTPPMGIARMRLRTELHRPGAAAPDPPGDGERAPIVPYSRRRPKTSSAGGDRDAPPSSNPPRDASGEGAPDSGAHIEPSSADLPPPSTSSAPPKA